MRLLAFAPLLALAAADLFSSPLCPPGASTSTLWLAEDSAFACAPLPGADTGSYAAAGNTCITTSAAALQGSRDLCEGSGDCVGGFCVEVGGGMRRVCWTAASAGECAQFSE